MEKSIKNWLRISILNLLLVSIVGVLMRYKIAFSFPLVNQKHLLYAHSNFAFIGWVTQTLFVFMVLFLTKYRPGAHLKKYNIILVANLVCAYLLLVLFVSTGYSLSTVLFSTLSVFISYLFCYWYWKDLRKVKGHPSKKWFLASLIFNVLSAGGTFYLAYMMYSGSVNQNYYLASMYYHLHFQYNGWFFFASMGLLIDWFTRKYPQVALNKNVFRYFALSCIPAYFLSTLWAKLPLWLYVLVVAAAIVQTLAWGLFLYDIKKYIKLPAIKNFNLVNLTFVLVTLAASIKFILQLGSTIPIVSKLAFGFRPIVIAYLHLILLAVFTLFLLGYTYVQGYFGSRKMVRAGILVIIIGVFANEFILLVQGVAAFSYTPVVFVNEFLLLAAGIIFLGIFLLLISKYDTGRGASLPAG